jgi:hypothetical protein
MTIPKGIDKNPKEVLRDSVVNKTFKKARTAEGGCP